MKLRNLLFGLVASIAAVSALTAPTLATDAPRPEARTINEADTALPASTFSSEEVANDAGVFWFGKNLLFAGRNVTVNQISRGLLFAAGDSLQLGSQSEYAFIAGNNIMFRATVEKDLFAAGNTVSILKDAKVGRDVFAAGSSVVLEANIPGDVSFGAGNVTIKDAVIDGNLNLDAEFITFQGKVEVRGALSYNDDALVSGLTNVSYGKLETYTPVSRNLTVGEIWLSQMMGVVGLFVTIALIFLVFPRAKNAIAREATLQRFGTDLMVGLAFVILVPLLSLIFLVSFFAASTAIFLIGIYFIIFYLAKAFAGAWLGHIIVKKLCRCNLPMLVEALIGILIITCASIIPGLGFVVMTLTLVLGAGLIISCLRAGGQKSSETTQIYYAADDNSADTPASGPSRPSAKSSRAVSKTSRAATSRKTATKAATSSPTKASSVKKSSAKSNTKTTTSKTKK